MPDTVEEIREYLLVQLALGEKDADDIFKMFEKLDTNSSLKTIERIGESRAQKNLDAIDKILMDACEPYNDGQCQTDCDVDPNGWDGCYTRKILDVIKITRVSKEKRMPK